MLYLVLALISIWQEAAKDALYKRNLVECEVSAPRRIRGCFHRLVEPCVGPPKETSPDVAPVFFSFLWRGGGVRLSFLEGCLAVPLDRGPVAQRWTFPASQHYCLASSGRAPSRPPQPPCHCILVLLCRHRDNYIVQCVAQFSKLKGHLQHSS